MSGRVVVVHRQHQVGGSDFGACAVRRYRSSVSPGRFEVSSRLWPATLVGPRTWRNAKSFIRSIAESSTWTNFPLVTSDDMKFYGSAIQVTFGVGCVHAQAIKKIKKDRVVKVGTKLVIGSE